MVFALKAGTKLGPYELIAPLGAGGMGEVYRASDTRLDREVAIKILPEAFARDAERVARFQREAKVLASLNHPHIAAIYGFEEANGVRFLVLELVEGQTLAERLGSGPMPVDESLEVCKQIAEAVEAAHEQGVIHRDLKPGNVKITPDGLVKVLDFGLAKALAGDTSASNLANSPTITVEHTRPGVVLGTAAYMSPEQARGKPLDKRTDIWSFGCVLYECLAGRRPFEGETSSDIVARILERDPDYERLPANTPPTIRSLLRHCLEKDRKQRYRDIGDAVLELGAAIRTRAWSTTAMSAVRGTSGYQRRRLRRWVSAALLLVLGLALGITVASRQGLHWLPAGIGLAAPASAVTRLSLVPPAEFRLEPGEDSLQNSHLLRDGRTMIFIGRPAAPEKSSTAPARRVLLSRRLDSYDVKVLPGTEGVIAAVPSPDSRWIAFLGPVSSESEKWRLAKVPADGSSSPITLMDWRKEWRTERYGSFGWLPDGDILILDRQGRFFIRVPAAGGEESPPTTIDRGELQGFFAIQDAPPKGNGVLVSVESYTQRGYETSVAWLDLKTARLRILIEGGVAAYSPTGHLLFSRGENLLAVPFDLDRAALTGGPVAVASGLRAGSSWENGWFRISETGTLAYVPGGHVGVRRRVGLVGRDGKVEPWSDDRRAFEPVISVSRNGRRIAVVIANAEGLFEIWTSDVDAPRLRRFAASPKADCTHPCWTADGEWLAYTRTGQDDQDGIYRRRADGSDEPERLLKRASVNELFRPRAWSPDGTQLLISRSLNGNDDILSLTAAADASGTRTPDPLLTAPFNEDGANFSPDGKWIGYDSDESGRYEGYIRAFRADGTLGTPIPVTTSGGNGAWWTPDGKTLLYPVRGGRVMAVDVTLEPSVAFSPPREVLDFAKVGAFSDDFSMLPDGRFAIIQKGEDEGDVTQLNVVLNWFEELKAKVAATK